MAGVMKIMVTSFKRTCSGTVVFSAPDPAIGHCPPLPPQETPGHAQACLGQSLVGSVLLSSGSWCTEGFVCAHQESVSPALCSSAIKSHWPPVSNCLGVPNERYQGNISSKMGTIKDKNGMTEAEDTKKRWEEYTELHKNDLNGPDNHDGVITHLEPDILDVKSSGLQESSL